MYATQRPAPFTPRFVFVCMSETHFRNLAIDDKVPDSYVPGENPLLGLRIKSTTVSGPGERACAHACERGFYQLILNPKP